MGMFAFRLTLLLCSLTTYRNLVESASVLDNSSDPWRNLLLNEDEEIRSQQSPPLSRRITPKSVFIAPIFDKCPLGTRLDPMGKCVKVVRIDEAANQAVQWTALEQKLNALFRPSVKPKEAITDATTLPTTSTTTPEPPINTTFINGLYEQNNGSAELAGPFQLSIPIHSKNSSENMDDDLPPMLFRNGTLFNLGAETTTPVETEITTDMYGVDNSDTTPPTFPDGMFSTNYPEGYTLSDTESVSETAETTTIVDLLTPTTAPAETEASANPPKRFYAVLTEASSTGQSVTLSETPASFSFPAVTEVVAAPSDSFKRFQTHSLQHGAAVVSSELIRPEPTPVASTIYRYPQGQVGLDTKLPFRFPEPDRLAASRNPVGEKTADHRNVVKGSDGAASTSRDSDISDSNISSSSSSSSSSNSITLDSISNSKNDLYQKLPLAGGWTRPKCDPASGYDCGSSGASTKVTAATAPGRLPYLPYMDRAPLHTLVRFPGMYTKGSPSTIRFPPGQKQPTAGVASVDDSSVVFPDVDVTSRYWESSRYPPLPPPAYWSQWDPSKAHYVRIWPSNMPAPAAAAQTNYHVGDINYSFRSQSNDYS